MDPRLVADIKNAEGCNLRAYRDTLGYWTIGYGHKLAIVAINLPSQFQEITQAQADEFLTGDLAIAQGRAQALPEWKFLDTPCRQNAVIELEFNMAGKWKLFAQTRLDIQNQNWQKAHDDLLNSLWAKQVGPTRSNRLANYLLEGTYV